LTNAFSKRFENHAWAIALFTTYYNFVRIHKALRMSPAMAAGVIDRLWEIGDIVALVEAADAKPGKRRTTRRGGRIRCRPIKSMIRNPDIAAPKKCERLPRT